MELLLVQQSKLCYYNFYEKVSSNQEAMDARCYRRYCSGDCFPGY